MPVQPKPAPPLYARLALTNSERSFVVLSIFGKEVPVEPFVGYDHYNRAETFVFDWNEHLASEWQTVRETSARIMQAFTRALQDFCVNEDTIKGALERVKKDVTQ